MTRKSIPAWLPTRRVADVRMTERSERLRLALEPLLQIGIGRNVPGKDLDGDRAIQAGISRPVDLPHPAGTERRGDLIGAEPRARGQGHVREFYGRSRGGTGLGSKLKNRCGIESRDTVKA